MAVVTVTPLNVRPLEGCVIEMKQAAAAFNLGDAVYLTTAGKVAKTTGASGLFYGIPIASDQKATAVAAGDWVNVVVFGPVTGFSSMTPGTLIRLSATAGKLDGADGTVYAGYAQDDTTLFVMPTVTGVGS